MRGTDDRGKSVRLIPRRQLGVFRAIQSPIPMDARSSIYAAMQKLQWSGTVLIPLLIGLLCIFIWTAAWVFFTPTILNLVVAPLVIKGLIMGLAPALPLPLLMYIIARAARSQVTRIVIKHRYCATCGYSLSDLAPADDGCTVCPECGSAWRIGAPAATDAPPRT